jgi:crooked neck
VYKACLETVPHKSFTFGKVWLMAAHFEVRQKDLTAARKLLGRAIGESKIDFTYMSSFCFRSSRACNLLNVGMCCKENILKGYIELELQLGEVERCRAIYGKYLEFAPHNCTAWRAFAQLETNVGEIARARSVRSLLDIIFDICLTSCFNFDTGPFTTLLFRK